MIWVYDQGMTQQFPPTGFVPTESAVAGITVFMPAPPAPDVRREVVDFKCPNCGANQAYSAADQSLTCTACGYREVPRQEVVGKKAAEFEFKVETLQQAAQGWGVERKELACQNCGAVLNLPPDMMTHVCPFCLSSFVVQQKAAQDVLRPTYLIPPKVADQAARDRVNVWLGSSWMTPRALSSAAVLDRFTSLYLPFWTFDARTAADWKAEVGHTVTTGTGKNRRTYTVWHWKSGHVDLTIDDLLVSGTARVSEVILGKMSNFSTAELVPYDSVFLAGISTLAYERNLEAAWEIGRSRMRGQTKDACYRQINSSKVRNFSMQMDFNDESWRYVLLPVYVSTYKYQDRTFQVLVNGLTGKVGGQRPVDWFKVGLAVAGIILAAILGMILTGTLFSGQTTDSGSVWLMATVFFGILGGAGAFMLLKTAAAMDDA